MTGSLCVLSLLTVSMFLSLCLLPLSPHPFSLVRTCIPSSQPLCQAMCLNVSCFIWTVSRLMSSAFSFAFPVASCAFVPAVFPCVSTLPNHTFVCVYILCEGVFLLLFLWNIFLKLFNNLWTVFCQPIFSPEKLCLSKYYFLHLIMLLTCCQQT